MDVQGSAGTNGDSEVWAVPPGGLPTVAKKSAEKGTSAVGFGVEGSNAGEVDPGVARTGETVERGGTGLVDPVGGMGERDMPAATE